MKKILSLVLSLCLLMSCVAFAEGAGQFRHHRRLARAADRYVADADDVAAGPVAFFVAFFVKPVANAYYAAVNFSQEDQNRKNDIFPPAFVAAGN